MRDVSDKKRGANITPHLLKLDPDPDLNIYA